VPEAFFFWGKISRYEANDTHTNLKPRLRISGVVLPNFPPLLNTAGKILPT
jgi:hypothetical protein